MGAPPDLSPARSLDRASERHPRRPHVVWGLRGRTDDVATSALRTRRAAALLRAHGIGAGDRVAIVAPNSPWHFLLHVACARLHAVSVPLSPRLPAPRLAELLDDCSPRLVLLGEGVPATHGGCMALADFAALVDAHAPLTEDPPSCHDELASIVYTSGSSGRARGVELTHANLWWGSTNFREGFEHVPGRDVVGVCAPLSHIGGFNGTTLDTFACGGTLVVLERFHPLEVLDAIEEHRITQMFLVPAMCHALLDAQRERRADLSSLRAPLVGGDALTASLAHRLSLAGLTPIHVWGMTETSAAGAMLHPEVSAGHEGSIGHPFPHIDIRLVDHDGHEVEAEGRGEMQVRGPGVTSRYHGSDPTTDPAFDGEWLRTGDLGERDADGFLRLIGRLSRMIDTAGEMVAPTRVEEALRLVPGVRDALVVGMADDTWGEVVAALLVTDDPSLADPALLADHLADRLAPWERPRRLLLVEALPLGPTGKPDALAARDMLKAGCA